MRFVWVAKEVPLSPDNGAMLYSNGLIQGLLKRGATGTLIAFARPGAAGAGAPGLQVHSVSHTSKDRFRFLSLLSGDHSDSFRHKNAEFAKVLRNALRANPDVLVIDYFCMGWTLAVLDQAVRAGARRPIVVHIAHDHESSLRVEVAESMQDPLLKRILRIDAAKAAKLEGALLCASDLLVTITEEDKFRFQKEAPRRPILTLTPGYDGRIAPTPVINQDRPRRVVIAGAMDWIVKQHNLRRFLQAAEIPFRAAGIDVLVAGRAPQTFVDELADRYPFWKFLGPVKDIKPCLELGRIGVMPDDVGGGFKLKYLAYIFAGLPVAAIRSQLAGLPIDPERDMLTGDTPDELVAAIVDSMDDLPRLNTMRQRCWEACADAFRWDDRGALLWNALDDLLRERRVAQPRDFVPTPHWMNDDGIFHGIPSAPAADVLGRNSAHAATK